MITKEILKSEINKIQEDHLEWFYHLIKALETSLRNEKRQKDHDLKWHEFVQSTYGCLADTPIERPDQGTVSN